MNGIPALVLFDCGATHSFVSVTFAVQLERKAKLLPYPLSVEVADDRRVIVREVYRNCKIALEGFLFSINLIPLAMRELCVIVGMDWLVKNEAKISCGPKRVRIRRPGGEKLYIQGDAWRRSPTFCAAARAKRYMRREGGYLVYVWM